MLRNNLTKTETETRSIVPLYQEIVISISATNANKEKDRISSFL
jgi:hypothetical protein